MTPKTRLGTLLGASFLMATSAIGPGFLTQTAVFTTQFGASFGCVILASILLDIGAQVNVWRIIAVSQMRAQDIANALLPGLGYVLAALIVFGGLAFNIGNVAGAGLGVNVIFGISVEAGAVISALLAVGLFLSKEAARTMDRFVLVLGALMIGLTFYVAATAGPPLREAAIRSVMPVVAEAQRPAFLLAIVTLVGGTVGGYITFAGAHRLLEAKVVGIEALPQVTQSSVSGILVTACMRVALFSAVLGVVAQGLTPDAANPPASVFRLAAGEVGYRLFGVVMWAAAITSLAGSAYTSVSFLRTLSRTIDRRHDSVVAGFIMLSTAIFLIVGRPVRLLIFAGAVNGLILPIALAIMLLAVSRPKIVGTYRHPLWMTIAGGVVVVVMTAMGGFTLFTELPRLFH
jgi:Mn2+/Fe2+ NRAMP family transporter